MSGTGTIVFIFQEEVNVVADSTAGSLNHDKKNMAGLRYANRRPYIDTAIEIPLLPFIWILRYCWKDHAESIVLDNDG